MFRGKNTKRAKLIDKTQCMTQRDAFDLIKASKAKFDETVELHIASASTPRHADQRPGGAIASPMARAKTRASLSSAGRAPEGSL